MALASRGNCSLSRVERTGLQKKDSSFSSSSTECKEGDCSICCCCAILVRRSGRANLEKLKGGEGGGGVGHVTCRRARSHCN